MTEEAKRYIYALEDSIRTGFHIVGGVYAKDFIIFIKSMTKQLDDQNEVIDRIYDMRKTLQNDLKKLDFDTIAEMSEQLEQVTRERDAAVEAVKKMGACNYCKHDAFCKEAFPDCTRCKRACPCHSCSHQSNWQWRGVEVANDAQKGSYAES